MTQKQSLRADLINLLSSIQSNELTWFEVGGMTDEECQVKIEEIQKRILASR